MIAFFGSSGLTSPCATPTIFSYCPTSGHEKPPKVGDSVCVTTMLVMRACASDTASDAVTATAAAVASAWAMEIRVRAESAPACDSLPWIVSSRCFVRRSRAMAVAPEAAPSLFGTTRARPAAQRYFSTSLPIAWFTRAAQSSATPGGSAVVHCAPMDAAAAPAFR